MRSNLERLSKLFSFRAREVLARFGPSAFGNLESLSGETTRILSARFLTLLHRLVLVMTLTLIPLVIHIHQYQPTSPPAKFPFLIACVAIAALIWALTLVAETTGILPGMRIRLRWDGLAVALLLLLLYLLVRCWTDDYSSFAWHSVAPTLAGLLWALMLMTWLRDERDVVWLLRISVFAVVPVVIYAVSHILKYDLLYEWWYMRPGETWDHPFLEGYQVYSTFGNPNYLVGYLGPWVLLSPAIFSSCTSPWGRAGIVALVCAVLLVIVHSYARGIWISLLCGCLVWLAVSRWRHVLTWHRMPGWRRQVLVLLVVVLLLALVPSVVDVSGWVGEFKAGMLMQDNSVRTRALMAVMAANLWTESPWIGLGMGSYFVHANSAMYDLTRTGGVLGGELRSLTDNLLSLRIERAHNEYLQVLTEWGVIGLGLLLWIFTLAAASGLRALVRRPPNDYPWDSLTLMRSLLAALAAYLVHAGYDFPLQLAGASLLLWTLVALLGVLNRDVVGQPVPRVKKLSLIMVALFAGVLGILFFRTGPAQIMVNHLHFHGDNNRSKAELIVDGGDPNGAIEFYANAESNYKRALRIQPEKGDVWFSRGVTYLYSKSVLGEDYFRRARDYFDMALRTFRPPYYYFHNAVLKMNQGREFEAIDSLLRILDIDPDYENAHFYLGMAYYRSGQFVEAAHELRHELSLDPKHLNALKLLGKTQLEYLQDLAGAEATYKVLLALQEQNTDALENLGDIYARAGSRYDPGNAAVHYSMARSIFEARSKQGDAERVRAKIRALPN